MDVVIELELVMGAVILVAVSELIFAFDAVIDPYNEVFIKDILQLECLLYSTRRDILTTCLSFLSFATFTSFFSYIFYTS